MDDRRRKTWWKRIDRNDARQRERGQGEPKRSETPAAIDLETATRNYIAVILETEVYCTYRTELERIKAHPELKAQVDQFRTRNYEFQSRLENDFNKLDNFEKEYQNFREDPIVADFLAAELALCRMLQKISFNIVDAMNFE